MCHCLATDDVSCLSIRSYHNIYLLYFPIPPGVKRPGLEADHSPTSITEIKNGGSYTSTSPYFFMSWCLIN
jgi:hypothetical protein